jgi:hypothetical protein
MKIPLFKAYSLVPDTPEQAKIRDGVIEFGGSISHSPVSGIQWYTRGMEYYAYGVFDEDETAVAFKLKYL